MILRKENYDAYVSFNGEKGADSPLALMIKDNKFDYYMVYDKDKVVSDLVVDITEENVINLNITFNFKSIVNDILIQLKRYYDYVTFSLDANAIDLLELIRNTCQIEKEYSLFEGKYEMKYIKIKL